MKTHCVLYQETYIFIIDYFSSFLTFCVHPQSIKLLDRIKATLELDGDLDTLDFLFDVMMPEVSKYQVNLFHTFYVMCMPKLALVKII